MTTQVNGVKITPKMGEVLSKWFNYSHDEDVYPIYYCGLLEKIQDYLCRNLDHHNEIEEIKEMLLSIISIKDDFRMLIPEKNEQD